AGLPAAASAAGNVDPVGPGRRRQGHRTSRATPPGRGPPPAGTAPTARTRRSGDPGGAVAATPPRPLADLLRHPGDAAALAPRPDRPPLDIPTQPIRPATHRPADPPAGAAPGCGQPDLGTPTHPRRADRPRLPGRRQHRVERCP